MSFVQMIAGEAMRPRQMRSMNDRQGRFQSDIPWTVKCRLDFLDSPFGQWQLLGTKPTSRLVRFAVAIE